LSRWGLYPNGFATPQQRIAFLISAREFQWATRLVSLSDIQQRLERYWSFLHGGWPLFTIGLMAIGLTTTVLRRSDRAGAAWPEALALLLAWLGMLVFVLNYAVYDIYVFYIPTYVPLAVLASLGASALIDGAAVLLAVPPTGGAELNYQAAQAQPMRLRSLGVLVSWWFPKKSLHFAPGRVGAPQIVAQGTAIVGALVLLATIWPALAEVRDSATAGRITFLEHTPFASYPYPIAAAEAPHQRAAQLVDQIEDDAIIFTDWGTVFTIYYVAQVEQGRTGIAAHEWFAQNDDPANNESVVRYIDANLSRRPIYFTFISDRLRPLYRFVSVGTGVELFRITGRTKSTRRAGSPDPARGQLPACGWRPPACGRY
jgi:hypothetical protein